MIFTENKHHQLNHQCTSITISPSIPFTIHIYSPSRHISPNARNTLFLTLSITLILLLGETHVGPILWKWITYKVMRTTWVLPNKSVNVRESDRKKVFLAFDRNTRI